MRVEILAYYPLDANRATLHIRLPSHGIELRGIHVHTRKEHTHFTMPWRHAANSAVRYSLVNFLDKSAYSELISALRVQLPIFLLKGTLLS